MAYRVNYRAAQGQQGAGTPGGGILLDVTTAQAELTRAQAAVVTARYQYLSAVASLQRAIGTDDLTASRQEAAKL